MKSRGNFEECEHLSPAVGVFGLGLVHNQLMIAKKDTRLVWQYWSEFPHNLIILTIDLGLV